MHNRDDLPIRIHRERNLGSGSFSLLVGARTVIPNDLWTGVPVTGVEGLALYPWLTGRGYRDIQALQCVENWMKVALWKGECPRPHALRGAYECPIAVSLPVGVLVVSQAKLLFYDCIDTIGIFEHDLDKELLAQSSPRGEVGVAARIVADAW